jgi:NAD(P)H dehydrogenase (quinone)
VFHTSCVIADHDLGTGGHDGRRDIEAILAASGIPFVIIRSAVFMDNMIRVWAKPSIVHHGLFAYPASDTLKVSWVALDDIAAYMVAALETPEAAGRRFLVGGPQALTGHEVAERLTRVLGKPVRFHSLTPDDFARAMSKLVTGSEEFERGGLYDRMAEMYRWYNAQPISPLSVDLAPVLAVLKVTPTPFETWAARQDWTA